MQNQNPNPLDAALKRIESILGQASPWAKSAHLMVEQQDNPSAFAAMKATELAIRETISESCRVWILTGNRQPMEHEPALLFYYRLLYASKLIQWIRSGGLTCPSKTQNEILIWLLIDSWPEIASVMWKRDLSPEF